MTPCLTILRSAEGRRWIGIDAIHSHNTAVRQPLTAIRPKWPASTFSPLVETRKGSASIGQSHTVHL